MPFEPAGSRTDEELVRMFARAEDIELLSQDLDEPPAELTAMGRDTIACVRRGTAGQRHQEKRRAVRAFVAAFQRHYGDEPAIALVLQPKGRGVGTVAILVPLGDLLEVRDILAGFRADDELESRSTSR